MLLTTTQVCTYICIGIYYAWLQICLDFYSEDIELRLHFYTCLACIFIICNCILQVSIGLYWYMKGFFQAFSLLKLNLAGVNVS